MNHQQDRDPRSVQEREQRRTERTHRCEALLWGYDPTEQREIGWLLESSDEGFAFVRRGVAPPRLGELIHAHVDGAPNGVSPRLAIVRRTLRVHDDLWLIACQSVLAPGQSAHAEVEAPPPPLVRTRRILPARRIAA